MSVSPHIMAALLSLDAYNRGYGAFLGNATSGLGGQNTMLGTAQLYLSSETVIGPAGQNASFFAQSYLYEGEIIIAYRGTDDWSQGPSGDPINGFPLGLGYAAQAPQAHMAWQFYDYLSAGASVTMTGHSLGGGLAGYVAAISGESAILFDNMTFESGVNTLRTSVAPEYVALRELYYNNGAALPALTFPTSNILKLGTATYLRTGPARVHELG